jgi:hypothetical protein
MRNKNASGLITLLHCLRATNEDYDMNQLSPVHMKQIARDYHGYVNHLAKYENVMHENLTSKSKELEMIRKHLVKLNLIDEMQENNEYA